MTSPAKPLRQRQDELIEEIMNILGTEHSGDEKVDSWQRQMLRTAIAQYTLKIKEQE